MGTELLIFALALLVLAGPLGFYCHRALNRPQAAPWEVKLLGLLGIRAEQEMTWRDYTGALLLFNLLGLVALYLILRCQAWLPLNPSHFAGMAPDLAFNTAVSFVTNTNWQAYSGEACLSYFSQALGLGVQNFLSAASGIAVLLVLGRSLKLAQSRTLGNFWLDLLRVTALVLLPLSLLLALLLGSQGVPQTWGEYPLGPVASQVAIKQLGSNGGGFYGCNSCHPLENPTPLSNFAQLLAIFLLPVSLCISFGLQVGKLRQGLNLLGAMTLLFLPLLGLALWSEFQPNAVLGTSGFNWEGKEARFNPVMSVLWAVATTVTSNGSVNCMHDSLSPLAGLSTLLGMLFGEVIYGGVGCGLYGMLIFTIVAVFVAGLMVGRTPEFLGKKIGPFDIKMCSLFILFTPAVVLGMASWAVLYPPAAQAVTNHGPHGFSEILYACASMGNNNGSAFGGLNCNQPFYNLVGGVAMLVSRFWLMIPVLALAGSLAAKRKVPTSAGTLPTDDLLFCLWLSLVVTTVGVLSFLPALALGPIVEWLQLSAGISCP